ncbi:haloacid dehalogenase-like hydrolase [Pleurocapsales cyanobacterium LEGE 06147]|nr:haloacid dehalogenase-like hydrolase [Pleurocapsales cyanobacterium LEGE 06147]
METAPDNTPIILDFDETLFLRNSTEEYLNSLQPRLIGAVLLALMSFLKPWNWLPSSIRGERSRDWVRVVVTTLFFPWTPLLWQRRAQQLAHSHTNAMLVQALNKNLNSQLILATQGFDFIVRPICKHLPLPINKIIACRFWQGSTDRNRGKYLRVTSVLGEDVVTRAIAVTDSIDDDAPLLSSVSLPCLVTWPTAQYIPAMADIYIPLLYTERVKLSGQHYFFKVIVAEDLLFLILGTSWLSNHPILHATSLLFLMVSFWCIYEIGYMENDLIAEKFEKDPALSENYQRYKKRINLWQPWFWAIILAIPGIILLESIKVTPSIVDLGFQFSQLNRVSVLTPMGFWLCLLIALRASYWIYNRIDKKTRLWLYPVLQAYKCFGFLCITVTNLVGSMLFVSQVLSRWLPYIIYRYSRTEWLDNMKNIGQLLRWVLFAFMLAAVVVGTQNPSLLINWQAAIVFSYCLFRGRRQFWEIVSNAHPIWQDAWERDK